MKHPKLRWLLSISAVLSLSTSLFASACASGEDASASAGGGKGGGSAGDGGGTGGKDGGTGAKDGGGGGDSSSCTPDGEELCDGKDNDCNGQVDDAPTDGTTYYEDKDGDNYGVSGGKQIKACKQPTGYGDQVGDCNDDDPAYHPGALENNCDDPNDYNCDGNVGFEDNDGDGYPACKECDDSDKNVYPGATEICDGKDDDCDGSADAPGGESDQDSDGVIACKDCNDKDKDVFPGNPEKCDGKDNDCNGSADFTGGEQDQDGDKSYFCEDCDDLDKNNYPGNTEKCDAQDNDCNGSADFAGGEADGDGDGVASCLDCADNDPARFPGNPEACDGKDNDCNPTTTASGGEADGDGDGKVACADCNDNDKDVYQGNVEKCDGKDNNCNVVIDQSEVPINILCPNGAHVASSTCNGASGCDIGSCTTNWYDVNGTFSDGCECAAAPIATTGVDCASAISVGGLSDAAAATTTVQGNIPFAGRQVWYTFQATDDTDTNGDEFHVDIRFANNPGNSYRMDVFRNGCPGSGGTQLAGGEAQLTDWKTDFPTTTAGCSGGPGPFCGQGDCTATPVPNRTTCDSQTATYYVKITSVGAPSCAQYSLEMSNGKY